MPRRKHNFNFNRFAVIAALFVGGWIAIDYYLNVFRHPQIEETAVEKSITPAADAPETESDSQPQPEVVSSDGFTVETYRDDRYGFEFQYPVYGQPDSRCPEIKKTETGFELGIFSLTVDSAEDTLDDFVASQLEGMEIEKNEKLTVANRPAVKVDYQTKGMGWYGSDTYIEQNGRIYDFGILANEAFDKCGGIDNYEDRVYQSVVSTLKFAE